jgi:hypothetical protein
MESSDLWAEISELAKDLSNSGATTPKPKKLPFTDRMKERLTLLSKRLDEVQGDFEDVAQLAEWQQARDTIAKIQAHLNARSML